MLGGGGPPGPVPGPGPGPGGGGPPGPGPVLGNLGPVKACNRKAHIISLYDL